MSARIKMPIATIKATPGPKKAATPMIVVASRTRITTLTHVARLANALKRYASSFKRRLSVKCSFRYLLADDCRQGICQRQRRGSEQINFYNHHQQTEPRENNRDTAEPQRRSLNQISDINILIGFRADPRRFLRFHRRPDALADVQHFSSQIFRLACVPARETEPDAGVKNLQPLSCLVTWILQSIIELIEKFLVSSQFFSFVRYSVAIPDRRQCQTAFRDHRIDEKD